MLAAAEGANVRSLCRRFGISPTTGYKWLERWRLDAMAGLEELSRRPHGSPSRSVALTEQAVLSLRAKHPAWGGRKIARRMKDLGHEAVPSPSTVTAILKRHGIELGAHGGGQSVAAEGDDKPLFDCLGLLVGAGRKHHGEARVIVEHG